MPRQFSKTIFALSHNLAGPPGSVPHLSSERSEGSHAVASGDEVPSATLRTGGGDPLRRARLEARAPSHERAGVEPKVQELPKPRKTSRKRASEMIVILMPKPAQTCRNSLAALGPRSKPGSETNAAVRIRSATRRESGALIRSGAASSACGERRVHRRGDSVCAVEGRTVRKNSAGIACRQGKPREARCGIDFRKFRKIRNVDEIGIKRVGACLSRSFVKLRKMHRLLAQLAPTAGTPKSDSESKETVRIRSATRRESGALILAAVAGNAFGDRHGHRSGDPSDGSAQHSRKLSHTIALRRRGRK